MLTTSSTLYSFSRSYSSCITGNLSLLSNFPFPFPPSPWQSPFSLFLWFVYYACMCVCVCVCMHTHTLSHVLPFAAPWTAACQAPLSMEFSRQEYWSGWPFPPLVDPPGPGIEPTSLAFPALSGRFFITVPPTWLWLL